MDNACPGERIRSLVTNSQNPPPQGLDGNAATGIEK